MQFSIKATGDWKFLRVRDDIAPKDDVFNGDATEAETVEVVTNGGSSGRISVWARDAAGSTNQKEMGSRSVREGDLVEIKHPPS